MRVSICVNPASGREEVRLPNGDFVDKVYYDQHRLALEQDWAIRQRAQLDENKRQHKKRQKRQHAVHAKRVERRARRQPVSLLNPIHAELRGSAPGREIKKAAMPQTKVETDPFIAILDHPDELSFPGVPYSCGLQSPPDRAG